MGWCDRTTTKRKSRDGDGDGDEFSAAATRNYRALVFRLRLSPHASPGLCQGSRSLAHARQLRVMAKRHNAPMFIVAVCVWVHGSSLDPLRHHLLVKVAVPERAPQWPIHSPHGPHGPPREELACGCHSAAVVPPSAARAQTCSPLKASTFRSKGSFFPHCAPGLTPHCASAVAPQKEDRAILDERS